MQIYHIKCYSLQNSQLKDKKVINTNEHSNAASNMEYNVVADTCEISVHPSATILRQQFLFDEKIIKVSQIIIFCLNFKLYKSKTTEHFLKKNL